MASIEIRTTQNVTIEYELAPLRDRFFAFFIDLVIFYTGFFLFWLFFVTVFGNFLTGWGAHFIWLLLIVGLMLYHLASEIFANGQSLGKKVVKIKVVRLDGREPGLGDYLLRSIFLLVDFFLSLGVLAAVLIGSTFRSQRLGDLAANTAVIRARNKLHFHLQDILKIQTLESYEPKYPEVRQMKEEDVILIKNLLARYDTWGNIAHIKAVNEAAATVSRELSIELPTGNKIDFLRTLIRDYIVLTR